MPQHGNGYSVVDTYSKKLFGVNGDLGENYMEITIEPCADLDGAVALYR